MDRIIAIAWHFWCILNGVNELSPTENDIDQFTDYFIKLWEEK